jgi:hypothetical protein
MGARWYDPTLRTFLSRDPAGYAFSFDEWAYTVGDPWNFVDRTGWGPNPNQNAASSSLPVAPYMYAGAAVCYGFVCPIAGFLASAADTLHGANPFTAVAKGAVWVAEKAESLGVPWQLMLGVFISEYLATPPSEIVAWMTGTDYSSPHDSFETRLGRVAVGAALLALDGVTGPRGAPDGPWSGVTIDGKEVTVWVTPGSGPMSQQEVFKTVMRARVAAGLGTPSGTAAPQAPRHWTDNPSAHVTPATSAVGPRNSGDVSVNSNAPDPKALAGRRVGNTRSQNTDAQAAATKLDAAGATDIRINQQQVDIHGNRVGRNRPDLQFTLDGKRYYVEYDRTTSNRALDHWRRILSNDPNGNVILLTMD